MANCSPWATRSGYGAEELPNIQSKSKRKRNSAPGRKTAGAPERNRNHDAGNAKQEESRQKHEQTWTRTHHSGAAKKVGILLRKGFLPNGV